MITWIPYLWHSLFCIEIHTGFRPKFVIGAWKTHFKCTICFVCLWPPKWGATLQGYNQSYSLTLQQILYGGGGEPQQCKKVPKITPKTCAKVYNNDFVASCIVLWCVCIQTAINLRVFQSPNFKNTKNKILFIYGKRARLISLKSHNQLWTRALV